MKPDDSPHTSNALNWLRGLAGAAVGGALGVFLFGWIVRQGFYGIILPGTLMGLGASAFAKSPSKGLAVVCTALAIPVGFFAEWRYFPFVADDSLGYFVGHLGQLRPITLALIGLGAAFAGWFALGGLKGVRR